MNDDKKLQNIINDIDYYLVFRKGHWLHDKFKVNSKLEIKYVSDSMKIDKEMAGKIKATVIRECNPTTSILSRSEFTARKNKSVREIVTPHIKNRYLLKLDIKHYFENIRYNEVEKVLSKTDLPLWFIEKFYFNDKFLRRGLHASSFIAEIIGVKIDNIINKILHERSIRNKVVYSRYCDDLLLSCDNRKTLQDIELVVSNQIQKLGFSINNNKSKLVHTHTASILGLHVHNRELIVPKRFKKKTRVRIHYANKMFDECNMHEESSIDIALRAIGSAVGSLQYIINNSFSSKSTILKYALIKKEFYVKLAKLEEARDLLLENENPISIKVNII